MRARQEPYTRERTDQGGNSLKKEREAAVSCFTAQDISSRRPNLFKESD